MLVRPRLRQSNRLAGGRGGPEPGYERRNSRLSRARCPICGTLVGPGDALGLVGGAPAHAECALVDWLRAPEPGKRDRSPEANRTYGGGDEMGALLEAFERLRGVVRDRGS